MNKKPFIVAVIPARGGSKRLPRKNIIDLNGKSLIAYTIEAALKSKYINKVIVSTEDKEIAEVAEKFGAKVPFIRPAKLASDTASTLGVLKHAVTFIEKEENKKIDIVITLQPTSPLRTVHHIDESIEKFLKNNFDSLVSIKSTKYPAQWLMKSKDNNFHNS